MAMGPVRGEPFTLLQIVAEIVRTLALASVALAVILSLGHPGARSSANLPAGGDALTPASGGDGGLSAVASRSEPYVMFIVESEVTRERLEDALGEESSVRVLLGEPARKVGVAVASTRLEVAQLVIAAVDFAVLPTDLTSFED